GEAGRACGRREGVGVPRPKLHSASEPPVSGRIRTRSVQPSAIGSAQGRVGPLAELSHLSTPDSILMCHLKFRILPCNAWPTLLASAFSGISCEPSLGFDMRILCAAPQAETSAVWLGRMWGAAHRIGLN